MTRLALVELLGRDGRPSCTLPVDAWPVRIGRAIDNDVVVDDPHVAPYHAVIDAVDGGAVELLALPSLNGVLIGRRRLAAGERVPLPAADVAWALGSTRLRVRLAGEPLEPERPLQAAAGHRLTVLLVFVLWGWLLADRALHLDPGAEVTEWLPLLLGFPAVLAGWCLLWALASKLFQHRFDFWPHLSVAVRFVLAAELAEFVLPLLAGITGWALPSRVAPGVSAALAVAMLWSHARLVLPTLRRALALLSLAAYLAGTGILLGLNLQRDDRWFSELYVSMLPPPALVWARPVAQDLFVKETTALRDTLDRRVREAQAEQKAAVEGDDE